MVAEEDQNPNEEPDSDRGGLVAKLLRNPIQKLAIGAVVGTLCLGGAYLMSLTGSGDTANQVNAERALELLDAEEYDQAKHMATTLAEQGALTVDEAGIPTFIIGAALAAEAREEWDETRQRALYMIAARYLQESLVKGFPKGEFPRGTICWLRRFIILVSQLKAFHPS